MRDALCHTGNLTLAMQMDAEKPGEIDDELCHTHSEYLRRAADISGKRAQDGTSIRVFIDFIGREDPSVLPAIEAILATAGRAMPLSFLGS
jgi:hypothetical protein